MKNPKIMQYFFKNESCFLDFQKIKKYVFVIINKNAFKSF